MKRAPFVALVFLGCATPRPEEPLSSSVRVRVVNGANVTVESPIRYAVVWTTKERGTKGFVTTADGPIEIGSPTTVPLSLPEARVRATLDPVESLAVTPFVNASVYRPRFVIYGDVNGDEHFEPAVLGRDGTDSILGVDDDFQPTPAALLDLDATLSRLSLSETRAFYDANGGRYTPFVWAAKAGDGLFLGSGIEVSVSVRDSIYPQTDLDCLRNVHRSSSIGFFAPSPPPAHAVIDASLDAKAVCGTTLTDCSSTDLSTVTPPTFEEDSAGDTQHLVQCRANDAFEFLLFLDTRIACEDCNCSASASSELFVTTPTNRPAWWPCGSTVPYCESSLPASAFDQECRTKG